MSAVKVPLVVALDVPGRDAALELARVLAPVTPWMKVGLELFTAAGPGLVSELKDMGCKVFLDLKFHDIPNTVAGAVHSAIRGGADICNVHVSGGEAMCRAAADAAASERAGGRACLLLGVTVLTSAAAAPDTPAKVVEYALNAKSWGLDGVVCSGQEVSAVKAAAKGGIICLCPGIRPAAYARADDQSRVITPLEAVLAGADYLVVGRPVTRAKNPAAAAQEIIFSYS
jgi:orotidine-5'-phosphate decarboxylase